MLRAIINTLAFVFAGTIIGCGNGNPETYPVTGTVVFADGTPLTDGSVEFETEIDDKPITAIGQIGPDGTFKLGTYEATDGARPGQHRVAVFANNEIGTKHERPDKLPPLILDPRFSNFNTSKLQFTVKEEGENNFRIEVERVPDE
jgi:hypothetical protein